MRQRKVKNLETKYEDYSDILIADPPAMKGKWAERSGDLPVWLEIGCGKGKFISEMASRESGRFFVAVEGNKSVMLRAMEKVRAKGLSNVVFIPEFAEDLSEWFADSEVSGIYLNFSDPLPKNYWYRRRLTYRERLKSYFRVLSEDGTVTFKTDNTKFFEWSILEIQAADLKILDITRDLHAEADSIQDPAAREAYNIETEYEAKFRGQGEKIKRVVIGRRVPRNHITQTEDIFRTELSQNGEPETATESDTERKMAITSLAAFNGRDIPKEDKVFASSGRGKAATIEKGAENVINATVGALMDDDGRLIVLDSVAETIRSLTNEDFVEYAPIAGTPDFRKAIVRAAFGSYEPRSFVKAVAAPGGTGAIRNAVANYSCPGDRILTHNWHWAPYKSISEDLGRSPEYFDMFDEEGRFNITDFEYKVNKLIRNQEHLVIILNTPAGNPTGYSLSMDDWYGVKRVLDGVNLDKKVTLICDTAYMDFAGEEEETRGFVKVIDNLRANILPIIAYSASKTFTLYGMRCAAMICLAHSPEIADEFEQVCSYSARAMWSNSPRAPQVVVERIYTDPELLARTDEERRVYRNMLLARGRAFEEEAAKAGLDIVPFSAGFFVSIPCKYPDALCSALEKEDVYLIAVGGGVRVSIAAISEAKCRKLPYMIKAAMDNLD